MKSVEVSPLPSRALSQLDTSLQEVMAPRKHSKQSLSQPTIPEEGPEHIEEMENASDQSAEVIQNPVSVLRPKPELKVVKNLSQESTGAIAKDKSSSFSSKPTQRREEGGQKILVPDAPPRSPKSIRQESVEKLLKAIRVTTRMDTKTKKRENSLSPSSQAAKMETSAAIGNNLATQNHSNLNKSSKKDVFKKNAHENKKYF